MTILWNEVTTWWNEVTKGWNEVVWNEVAVILSMPLYSSTSGILKAWPPEYDPDLIHCVKRSPTGTGR